MNAMDARFARAKMNFDDMHGVLASGVDVDARRLAHEVDRIMVDASYETFTPAGRINLDAMRGLFEQLAECAVRAREVSDYGGRRNDDRCALVRRILDGVNVTLERCSPAVRTLFHCREPDFQPRWRCLFTSLMTPSRHRACKRYSRNIGCIK